MALSIKITDDNLTFHEIIERFYTVLAPKQTKARFSEFFENVGRLKGSGLIADRVADHVVSDAFFAGIWFAKNHPDLVTQEDVPMDEDSGEGPTTEAEPKPKKSKKSNKNTKTGASGDTDGGMYG